MAPWRKAHVPAASSGSAISTVTTAAGTNCGTTIMADEIWEYYARDVSRAVEYMTTERDRWRNIATEQAERIAKLEAQLTEGENNES